MFRFHFSVTTVAGEIFAFLLNDHLVLLRSSAYLGHSLLFSYGGGGGGGGGG